MLLCKSVWQIFCRGILFSSSTFWSKYVTLDLPAFLPLSFPFPLPLTCLNIPLSFLKSIIRLFLNYFFSLANCQLPDCLLPLLLHFVPVFEWSWPGTKLRNKNRINFHFQGLTPGSHKWIRAIHSFNPAAEQSERSCCGEGFDFCSQFPRKQ